MTPFKHFVLEDWLPRRKKNAGSPKGVQAPVKPSGPEKIEAAGFGLAKLKSEGGVIPSPISASDAYEQIITQAQLEKYMARVAAQSNSYQGYAQQSQGDQTGLLGAQQKSLAQTYARMGSKASPQPEVEVPTVTGIKVKENPDGTFCLEFQNAGPGAWVITSVPDGIMKSLHKQWLMERNKKEDDDAGL